jgi:uncharacterized protein (DUF2147 family)
MRIFKTTLAIGVLCAATAIPVFAASGSPAGTFVDSYGTSFQFSLCGDGTALCGVLTNLEGESATEENLAFVGKQVMQAEQVGPNEWKGALEAGGISAEATVTMTGPDTIDIQGCRAGILCQTLTYNRA